MLGKALVAAEVPCDPGGIASRSHQAFVDAFLHSLCEIVCVSSTTSALDELTLNNWYIIPGLDEPV